MDGWLDGLGGKECKGVRIETYETDGGGLCGNGRTGVRGEGPACGKWIG